MTPHPALRTLKRYLDSNDAPFLWPLPPWATTEDKAVRRIRRMARTAMRHREVARNGWGAVGCAAAVWPMLSLIKSVRACRSGHRLHPGFIPSVFDSWWLQLAHNLRLADINHHRLDLPGHRRKVRRIVTDGENKYLLEVLNRGHIAEDIGDKLTFAAFCTRHNLPAPALLSCRRHASLPVEHLQDWPAADLFLKSAEAWGGQGMHLLRRSAQAGAWQDAGGAVVTPANIGDIAHRLLGTSPWLLQPRLTNSVDWAELGSGPDTALATVRVVTGRLLPDGPVEIIGGFMRFALRHAVVDNLRAGGIGADYDPRTGRLQAARRMADRGRPLSHHPETGGRIEGRIIPRWEDIAALARQAHALVADIATLGWDIALTPDGPVLIETNPHWGVPLDTPLGETSYPHFLLQPALRSRRL